MSYELYIWYITLVPWQTCAVWLGISGTVFAFFWCLRL